MNKGRNELITGPANHQSKSGSYFSCCGFLRRVISVIRFVGIGMTAFLFFQACTTEKLMFKESQSRYDFETTVQMVKDSSIANGWLVPWETDIQERYINEGYKEMTRATIVPVCRPEGGYNIVQHDKYKLITPLMPLQVSVYEKGDGTVYVSRMKVKMMANMMSKTTRKNMKESGVLLEKTLQGIVE